MNCLIFGAGSIGAHHCFAFRELNWNVNIFDPDEEAIARFKEQIYPQRYQTFDTDIQLSSNLEEFDRHNDLVIIGSPPDTHESVFDWCLENKNNVEAILLEKPLSNPFQDSFQEKLQKFNKTKTIFVGFNHLLSSSWQFLTKLCKDRKNELGKFIYGNVEIRESWNGVLGAHPWFNSVYDSYLGNTCRGGGSLFEHSHGTSFAVDFLEKVVGKHATVIDSNCATTSKGSIVHDNVINFTLKNSKVGSLTVTQDSITWPAKKCAEFIFENGWVSVKLSTNLDVVQYQIGKSDVIVKEFRKNRKIDFSQEANYINDVITNNSFNDVITLDHGLCVQNILDDVWRLSK